MRSINKFNFGDKFFIWHLSYNFAVVIIKYIFMKTRKLVILSVIVVAIGCNLIATKKIRKNRFQILC